MYGPIRATACTTTKTARKRVRSLNFFTNRFSHSPFPLYFQSYVVEESKTSCSRVEIAVFRLVSLPFDWLLEIRADGMWMIEK